MNPLQLLKDAVIKHPRGAAGVAELLDVSRPLLSRVLTDKNPVPLSTKLGIAVISKLGSVHCPWKGQYIPQSTCLDLQNQKAPTHNPAAMNFFKNCQRCKLNERNKKC